MAFPMKKSKGMKKKGKKMKGMAKAMKKGKPSGFSAAAMEGNAA